MATTLTINGSAVTLSAQNSWPVALQYRYRGYSTLTIQRRGGPLQTLPDPWLGKPVALAIAGTTYFVGDVVDADPAYTELGWITTYQCRDLKARCDRVPLTDSNTLTDTAAFNLQADDPAVIDSRQGRTVGQMVTAVLTMAGNAAALDARGVGAYTSLSPTPVLPASTVADLALLTLIPPMGTYIQGEKLLTALEQFLGQWAPNHVLWIEPATGAIRVLDQRTFANHTLTLGTDPIDVSPLRRSIADCFQRVVVRGAPIAERKVISLSDGGLAEDFGYGAVSNAAAKAAWTPQQALLDKSARSEGTCSCTDTLHIVVDPTDATQAWGANDWDQTATGHRGVLDLYYSAGSGIGQYVSRRIVANGALAAGGTCTVQVDIALPAVNYDHFKIYGVSNGLGLVWKKYLVVDPDVGAAMTTQLTYPAPWVGANGGVAVMTSYPMGSVCWSSTGSPPYEEVPAWFTIDPSTSHLYFIAATYVTAGNRVPSDVRALIAVNTGSLTAIYPPDSGGAVYGGTSHTVEGLSETLTVTCLQWRDPANQTAMDAYAHDLHDSVKDTVVEGTVVYDGLYLTALAPGQAVSIAGAGYTTGWEGLALPILEAELRWNLRGPVNYTTLMRVGNRRAHYTAIAYLRPDRPVGTGLLSEGLEELAGTLDARAFARSFALGVDAGAGGGGVGVGAEGLDAMADPTSAVVLPEGPAAPGADQLGQELEAQAAAFAPAPAAAFADPDPDAGPAARGPAVDAARQLAADAGAGAGAAGEGG